jgi:hypothetical protein
MMQRSKPGSTEPERRAIITPSSGVKPMLVSTERPSARPVCGHGNRAGTDFLCNGAYL